MALPHFKALMVLLAGVAAGFVDGVSAATTPTGRDISVTPRALSSLMTPTVFSPRMSRSKPRVLRWFLRCLSSALPSPVSSTASSERRRLFSGFSSAQPTARHARSIVSCALLAYSRWASRARPTIAATSAPPRISGLAIADNARRVFTNPPKAPSSPSRAAPTFSALRRASSRATARRRVSSCA